MNNIKLIVGLANPGLQYKLTRHNAGAWYVELLAKQSNQLLKEKSIFFGYTAKINLANHDVRLLIPTTYMNHSGKSVSAFASFYHIQANEILIAHDDLDLMPGIIKIKFGGKSGGHNGLKDIQKNLGENLNFYRLRIGIGHPGDKNKVVGFVLTSPTLQEQTLINNSIEKVIRYTPILLNKKHLNQMQAQNNLIVR